ncbi:hypothetical protein FACS1894122_03630 [Alphaproteobacteria bacterium]|nr:hypothetical protein FACS1894122_03630 [Alphaproteobacteria bacterium]
MVAPVVAPQAFSASLSAERYAVRAGQAFSVERYARCACDDEKRKNKRLCYKSYLLALMAILSFSGGCFAKTKTTTKPEKPVVCDSACVQKSFAIVNLRKVASSCSAGKDIEKQMTEINDQSKNGHLELEDKIKSMEKNKTSDFDNRKIEEMQLILYDMVRTKKQQISDAYRNAISELENVIKRTIESIAVRDDIGFVIESEAILYACKDCRDVTEDVIKEVDNTCATIKVEMKE